MLLAMFRKSYPGVDVWDLELGEFVLLLKYMGMPTQDLLMEVASGFAGNGKSHG